jgi:hypothetical protein
MGLDTKTYWLTDRQTQCNFDSYFDFEETCEDLSCELKTLCVIIAVILKV